MSTANYLVRYFVVSEGGMKCYALLRSGKPGFAIRAVGVEPLFFDTRADAQEIATQHNATVEMNIKMVMDPTDEIPF